MGNKFTVKNFLLVITLITINTIFILKVQIVNIISLWNMFKILIPAVIIMGYLGHKIDDIISSPKNKTEAEYTVSVLNALKKMDKSITLQELNEKLKEEPAEPEENDNDDNLDI